MTTSQAQCKVKVAMATPSTSPSVAFQSTISVAAWGYMIAFTESFIKDAALAWFMELGYAVGHGPRIAPGELVAERDSFSEVVLVGRLREAIRRLTPAIPEEASATHKEFLSVYFERMLNP